MVFVIDRKSKKKIKEKGDDIYRFLARLPTHVKSIPDFLPRYVCHQITQSCKTSFEDQEKGPVQIRSFIKKYGISLRGVEKPLSHYTTLQEFFQRKLKPSARPISSPLSAKVMVSPADCRITVFETVSLAHVIRIKGSAFDISHLFPGGEKYENASLVLCRLAPHDYHRFHFPISGYYTQTEHIPGTYLSVQPELIKSTHNILTENRRAYTKLRTKDFGTIAYITVGATCVGSIVITTKSNRRVKKGEEYGTFAFGGSTIVLLIPKGKIMFSEDLVKKSMIGMETLIRMGDVLGYASSSTTTSSSEEE